LSLGYGSAGSFSWPRAYGTSWLADAVEDMIATLLIQRRSIEPFPMVVDFERRVYDAIDNQAPKVARRGAAARSCQALFRPVRVTRSLYKRSETLFHG